MSRLGAVLALVLLLSVAPAAHADETTLLPSRIVVLSTHTTPVLVSTPTEVRVRLESADGTPLAGRQMRIYEPSYIHVCCGPPAWRTTDANGVVSMTSYPEGNSANPQRYAAYWYGDATYAKTITEWTQPMIGLPTTLQATHATSWTSDDDKTIPVTVDVRRNGSCIDDTVVEIELAGPDVVTATAVTDHYAGCAVTVQLPAGLTPGTYAFTASTGHEGWYPNYEPVTISRTVTVKWQHTYTDAAGRGVVRLNPDTGEYLVTLTQGTTSGIQQAGDGLTRTGVLGTVNAWVMQLEHDDGAGTSAYGTFWSAGTFDVSGTIAGVPYELSK